MTAYTKDELLTLVTEDGIRLYHSRKTLKSNYKTIDDITDDVEDIKEINVQVNSKDLEQIFLFTDTLEVPANDQDWIRLLMTAEYLQLQSRHTSFLNMAIKEYLNKKDINVFCDCTFPEYIRKLIDPNFLTEKEEAIKKKIEQEKNELMMSTVLTPPPGPTEPNGVQIGPGVFNTRALQRYLNKLPSRYLKTV